MTTFQAFLGALVLGLVNLEADASRFSTSSQTSLASSGEFRVPAEFEPLESIWLSAPTVDYKMGWSMLNTQANMIKALTESVNVDYAVNGPQDEANLIDALINKGVSQSMIDATIKFHFVPHGDLWIRDTGGTFMKNRLGERQVIDFDFDAYRMKNYVSADTYAIYQLDNDVSYDTAWAKNASVVSSTLIAEGGNLHFNGKGTVIAVKKALEASNPNMTINQIEEELKRVFNLQKVIFINKNAGTDLHPVLESPLQVGNEVHFNLGVWHADEILTWVNPTTVMLPQVPAEELVNPNPFTIIAHEALEDAYRVLSQSTDQDGKPLTIIRAPEPSPIPVELAPGDLMYDFLSGLKGIRNFPTNGSPIKFVLAASYMNYVVTNNVVLIPAFYKAGRNPDLKVKDRQFKNLIKRHYPGRRVVQVDVDALAVGGGAMHCITQQVPKLDR